MKALLGFLRRYAVAIVLFFVLLAGFIGVLMVGAAKLRAELRGVREEANRARQVKEERVRRELDAARSSSH